MRSTGRTIFRFPTIRTRTTMNAASDYYCSYGLRDGQTERDSFVIGNWVHTISPKALVSVAPFYHFNESNYDSARKRRPGCDDLAPDVELCGRAGRCALGRRAEQLLRRALLVLPGGERSVRRQGERRQRDVATEHHGQRQGGAGGVLSRRSSAPGPVHHAAGRGALLNLPRRI